VAGVDKLPVAAAFGILGGFDIGPPGGTVDVRTGSYYMTSSAFYARFGR